jgi:hypothetical protein
MAYAGVAELADAHGSGPCARKGVQVQVLSPVLFPDGELRGRSTPRFKM